MRKGRIANMVEEEQLLGRAHAKQSHQAQSSDVAASNDYRDTPPKG